MQQAGPNKYRETILVKVVHGEPDKVQWLQIMAKIMKLKRSI